MLRVVPFKSTWEGGTPFFFVGCGGETILFYVGWGFFSIGGGGGGGLKKGGPRDI